MLYEVITNRLAVRSLTVGFPFLFHTEAVRAQVNHFRFVVDRLVAADS